MANILDGKSLAEQVKQELKTEVARLAARGVRPGLGVVLVGDDAASAVYVRNKTRACHKVGVTAFDHKLTAAITQTELLDLVQRLNLDPAVHGILVQLPLPGHLDPTEVIEAIRPAKDADGFHPVNLGRLLAGTETTVACTPLGIMRLIQHSGIRLAGVEAVVVGRSTIVGKPVAQLLLAEHCTVTLCHSRTRDLAAAVSRADVLVAAVGSPELIKGAWIKPGAVVIDVGVNRVGDRLVGDVEFAAAADRASAITPVPGGVGPMTIAMLLSNTVRAAARAAGG